MIDHATKRPSLKMAPKKQGPSYAHLRRAVRLFRNDLAPRSVRRHNTIQWLRSVELLGDKWRAIPLKLERQGDAS